MGGAAHPDELLARLTGRQWREWQVYCAHYLTPMQRADLNAAFTRRDCGRWRKMPKAKDLLVQYGGRRRKTAAELKATLMAWAQPAPKPTTT